MNKSLKMLSAWGTLATEQMQVLMLFPSDCILIQSIPLYYFADVIFCKKQVACEWVNTRLTSIIDISPVISQRFALCVLSDVCLSVSFSGV